MKECCDFNEQMNDFRLGEQEEPVKAIKVPREAPLIVTLWNPSHSLRRCGATVDQQKRRHEQEGLNRKFDYRIFTTARLAKNSRNFSKMASTPYNLARPTVMEIQ